MNIASANRLELLRIAESVAQEKLIDVSVVIEAMEESMVKAARMRFGADLDIRAKIDEQTGNLTTTRVRTVVEEIENEAQEVTLDLARLEMPDAKIGDEIAEELPDFDMGRIATQSSKQVILQKVREAERERHYEEFKDRVGTIIVGTVKRQEYGNFIIDITRGEAVLRREQKIGRESYANGERIRAYISDVRREKRGPQIFLSRTAREFMVELFKSEVPELYEGILEIRNVARDPGSRAKIAVVSYDSSIDPVGACVGMRGSRVQAVVNELQGEKVDIISWTDNLVDFIVSALKPANVVKVLLDDDGVPNEVIVPEDQLSLAIGRKGQNVRLASQLTGLEISIVTEEQEKERRNAKITERTQQLMDAIEVDEVFARLLVQDGFDTLEYLAACDYEELMMIEGVDAETAEEIHNRAVNFVSKKNKKALERARAMGLQEDLAQFEGLSPEMLKILALNHIFTLDEFAKCGAYELSGDYIVVNGKRRRESGLFEELGVTLEEAERLVMNARVAVGILDESEVRLGVLEEVAVDENQEPALG